MAGNHHILHMPMEWMNVWMNVYWCTYLHVHDFDIFVLSILRFVVLFLFFFFQPSSSSTTAALPPRSTAKSENTCTSVPATHVPAENDVPASHSVSLYRDGWVPSWRHRNLWLTFVKWQQIGTFTVIQDVTLFLFIEVQWFMLERT
jgi:hypothetical protein